MQNFNWLAFIMLTNGFKWILYFIWKNDVTMFGHDWWECLEGRRHSSSFSYLLGLTQSLFLDTWGTSVDGVNSDSRAFYLTWLLHDNGLSFLFQHFILGTLLYAHLLSFQSLRRGRKNLEGEEFYPYVIKTFCFKWVCYETVNSFSNNGKGLPWYFLFKLELIFSCDIL